MVLNQAVLLALFEQGLAADAENVGGAGRSCSAWPRASRGWLRARYPRATAAIPPEPCAFPAVAESPENLPCAGRLLRENERVLDGVLQLAHVSRPRIRFEQRRAPRDRAVRRAGRAPGRGAPENARRAAGYLRAARAAAAPKSRARSAGRKGPRGSGRPRRPC